MRRRPTTRLLAIVFVTCATGFLNAAAFLPAAEKGRGVYEDPLGRYRFSFKGKWRVAENEEDPAAPDHFYLVKRGTVAAELIITSRPFPASSRLSDFVDAEVEALDADLNVHRASLKKDLTVSGRPAVRLIARLVESDKRRPRRETLMVQYWFTKGGKLWSLLVLTTPAEEQHSKVISEIESTLLSSFKALEPDEVAQAIMNSKKVARLESGLAELTVPERWTLLRVEEDLVAAEFDTGRLYLFVVTDHEYGDTLKQVAHGFIENHAALEAPAIQLEGDCDIRGEPGYYIIFEGAKDRRPFRVQLIALTSGSNAFFLYGICEVDAWRRARPWITAVQYTINLIEEEPASLPGPTDENPD